MDDRMTGLSTSGNSQSASYTYAYNGDLLSRTLNGNTWTYLYNREDILRVSYASGDPMYLTQGPGIDDVLAEAVGSNINYAYKNMLSSVLQLANIGAITSNYNYDAWGASASWPVPGYAAYWANPYGYTGREWDAQGSYYYRARVYLPEVGRFPSKDMLLHGTYYYANNIPVFANDPSGWVTAQFGGVHVHYAEYYKLKKHCPGGFSCTRTHVGVDCDCTCSNGYWRPIYTIQMALDEWILVNPYNPEIAPMMKRHEDKHVMDHLVLFEVLVSQAKLLEKARFTAESECKIFCWATKTKLAMDFLAANVILGAVNDIGQM